MPDWNKVVMQPVAAAEARPAHPSLLTSVAHVCFHVADLEQSIHFYRDVLGLPLAFEFLDENGKRFGIYFHAGERTFIELFENPPQPVTGKPSYAHLCLEVADLDAAVAAIAERGWEVGAATLGKDGTGQAWLSDPDGNRIELHCYTAASLQGPWLPR